MSDVACVYRRAQHDAHLDNGSFDLMWEQGRREDDIGALRDEIHAYGLAAGTTTVIAIRRDMIDARFGRYRHSDYAKAVRKLVDEGRIDRADSVGIKDQEQLTFILPEQRSIFG